MTIWTSQETNRIRGYLLMRIREFDETGGVSIDPYNSRPTSHPMADGLFLELLPYANQVLELSQARCRELAEPVVSRLATAQNPDGGYGLGFSWNGQSPRTSFTITSALILLGLLRSSEAAILPESEVNQLSPVDFLIDMCRTVDSRSHKLSPPRFSRHSAVQATNVAAVTHFALQRARQKGLLDPSVNTDGILSVLEKNRVGTLGWRYSDVPNSQGAHVLDLLHTAYTIGSQLASSPNRLSPQEGLVALSTFRRNSSWIDKLWICPVPTALSLNFKSSRTQLLGSTDGKALLLMKTPARKWSVGASMSALVATLNSSKDDLERKLCIRWIRELFQHSAVGHHIVWREELHLLLGLSQSLVYDEWGRYAH